jgi:hypothetical protein
VGGVRGGVGCERGSADCADVSGIAGWAERSVMGSRCKCRLAVVSESGEEMRRWSGLGKQHRESGLNMAWKASVDIYQRKK